MSNVVSVLFYGLSKQLEIKR